MRLKAGILGHSFVERFLKAMRCAHKSSGMYKNMSLPEFSAKHLNLDQQFSHIAIEMDKCYLVRDLRWQAKAFREHPQLDCCLLVSGSNDLTSESIDPKRLAVELNAIGDYLLDGFGLKVVVFMGAIRRSKCRGMEPSLFASKVKDFNKELVRLCKQDSRKIFYSVKGFWRNENGTTDLPVKKFSGDGVHPGLSKSPCDRAVIKFTRNVRKALLEAAGRIHKKDRRYLT